MDFEKQKEEQFRIFDELRDLLSKTLIMVDNAAESLKEIHDVSEVASWKLEYGEIDEMLDRIEQMR